MLIYNIPIYRIHINGIILSVSLYLKSLFAAIKHMINDSEHGFVLLNITNLNVLLYRDVYVYTSWS